MWSDDVDGELVGVEKVVQQEAPFSVIDIKRRALAIYKAVCAVEVPECDRVQYPCGFYQDPDAKCSREARESAKDAIEEVFIPDEVLRRYVVARDVKKMAEEDFKKEQEGIKVLLGDRPDGKYKAGELTFTRSQKRTLDKGRLVAETGVELGKFEVVGGSFWTIR